MIARFLLAALAPVIAAATPSPSPTPELREIGHVRANAACDVLRRSIAPAVVNLRANDELIAADHRGFAKLAHDLSDNSSGAMETDKRYLQQVQSHLVANLKALTASLDDKQQFPDDTPASPDQRDTSAPSSVNEVQSQLRVVADAQRKVLDLVSGILETESLGKMQSELSGAMQSATSPTGGPASFATDSPASYLGSSGLPDRALQGVPTLASSMSTLRGHTIYDVILAYLELKQRGIALSEEILTASVVVSVDQCRAGLGQQTPAPSPSALAPSAPVPALSAQP